MNNIEKLKLSNIVSMKVMSNDFPIQGKTTIVIETDAGSVVNVTVKNIKARAKKEVENGTESAGLSLS